MKVKTDQVGPFIFNIEGVFCRFSENPSGVVDLGQIGKWVLVIDEKGVGRGGKGKRLFGGEVAGERTVIEEGVWDGGTAIDEVVVGGREEVGKDGEC